MQLKITAIPADGPEEMVEELNKFLRSHRVLSVERRLVETGGSAYWAVCVEYLERGGEGGGAGGNGRRGVDYREVLSEADFAVFAKLRELRKGLAEKEGVPPYSVFTNEQLAAMVTARADSLAALGKIDGIGQARLEKYGTAVLGLLKALAAPAVAAGGGKEVSA